MATKSVIQRLTREVIRKQDPIAAVERAILQKEPPVAADRLDINITNKIEKAIEPPQKSSFDYYLGFGGTGDALLLLAVCWQNPKAHVIFFGNDSSIPFIKDFFRSFNMLATVMPNVMGQPMANVIFDRLKRLPTFKQSAHLADGLYYEDWRNEEKYIPRIVNYVPEWRSRFGLLAKKLVVISPSGSHRDAARQRYLTRKEYTNLVMKYLSEGFEVYGIGSDRDFREYFFKERGTWWATNRILRDWQGNSSNHSLEDMLRIINTATEVISMDTWMKTYSMLAGVPTTVIETRWNGKYKEYGEDVTDWIFLNKKIWPNLKVIRVEDLI